MFLVGGSWFACASIVRVLRRGLSLRLRIPVLWSVGGENEADEAVHLVGRLGQRWHHRRPDILGAPPQVVTLVDHEY